jgi:hypothetical protein
MRKAVPPQTKVLRCAIYTRKSSDEGLEQDFNSTNSNASRLTRPATWHPNQGGKLIDRVRHAVSCITSHTHLMSSGGFFDYEMPSPHCCLLYFSSASVGRRFACRYSTTWSFIAPTQSIYASRYGFWS